MRVGPDGWTSSRHGAGDPGYGCTVGALHCGMLGAGVPLVQPARWAAPLFCADGAHEFPDPMSTRNELNVPKADLLQEVLNLVRIVQPEIVPRVR